MFPVSCRFSSFTISVHAEIFIPHLICFIICIKACNGTVSNLLIFRIPLCGIIQQQKIAPKMIIIKKKNKNKKKQEQQHCNIEIIFQKWFPTFPYPFKGQGNCFENISRLPIHLHNINISTSWTGFLFVLRMFVHISLGQTVKAISHFSKTIVIMHLRHNYDHDQTKTIFL